MGQKKHGKNCALIFLQRIFYLTYTTKNQLQQADMHWFFNLSYGCEIMFESIPELTIVIINSLSTETFDAISIFSLVTSGLIIWRG